MSARSPRRSFATPFVVTLATAAPLAACHVQAGTRTTAGPVATAPASPPPRTGEITPTNPPRPQPDREAPVSPRPPVATTGNGGVTTGPTTTPVIANPPRPTSTTATPPTPITPPTTTATTATTGTGGKVTPQGGKPVPPSVTPGPVPADYVPAPGAKATVDVRWTVSNQAGMCFASVDVACPAPVAGKPTMTCNPPAPQKVACPPNIAAGESTRVIKRAGQTECFIDHGKIDCPKGAICNPPPPRRVACPS